jgi:hypothetical protein
MQTFLPYSDFGWSASVLDNKRLGKQRVENLQIMKALTLPEYGWKNHPAVKMWRNHVSDLYRYQVAICAEWTEVRGFKDTCLVKTKDIMLAADMGLENDDEPAWLGLTELHRSHRSNLVRKNPAFYAPRFEVDLPDNLDYVWPVC